MRVSPLVGILGRVEPSDVSWERGHAFGVAGRSWHAITSDAPHGGAAHVVAYESTVWLFDGGHNRISEHATVAAAIEAGTAWIIDDRARNGTLQQQRDRRHRAEADARWRYRYGTDDPEVARDHGWDQDMEPDPDRWHDDR